MAKKPVANAADRPVMLSADSARRVGRMLSAYEGGDRAITPYVVPNGFTDGGDAEPVRLCKTTAAWAKGAVATLNVWEDGTPPNETQTAGETVEDVVNKFAAVATDKFCMIAKAANGSWYLIAAEC